MAPPPIAALFSQRSYHRRSASAKSAAVLFLAPPSRSFKEASWVRVSSDSSLYAFGQLTNIENVV
jgi:hypothetical protein